MTSDAYTTLASAAYASLPANTPDWIRAQDIAMTAGNALCDKDKKRCRQ